jgi:hypothetical protein
LARAEAAAPTCYVSRRRQGFGIGAMIDSVDKAFTIQYGASLVDQFVMNLSSLTIADYQFS